MTQSQWSGAVLYVRVSSEKQKREGHGVDAQIARGKARAKEIGLNVEKIFTDEAVSGGIVEREAIQKLFEYLAEHPGRLVITDDMKRLARSVEVHIFIQKTIKSLKCGVEFINQRLEDSPEGQFVEIVLAGAAELERKQNARQVKQKMIERMRAGYYCFCAPTGYKFEKVNGHKLIVPKQPEASFMTEALAGYASGRFNSQQEASDYLLSRGLKLVRSKFAEQCRNPLYAGWVHYPAWNIKFVPGEHEPIISQDVWQQIQDKLNNRPDVRSTDLSQEFPLRGWLMCSDCGRQMTGYFTQGKTKKIAYYACCNRKCRRNKHGLQRDRVTDNFLTSLQNQELTSELKELFEVMFEDIYLDYKKTAHNERGAIEQKINQLETEIERLITRLSKTGSELILSRIENEIEKKEKELINYQAKLQAETLPAEDVRTKLNEVLEYSTKLGISWVSGDLTERRTIQDFAFPDKIFVDEKGSVRTPTNPENMGFTAHAKQFLNDGGDGGSCTPVQPVFWQLSFSD
jgi:site-specific DNA recombinase